MKILKLKNGTTVFLDCRKDVLSVNFSIYFSVGSYLENDKNAGIAHTIEHMFFKGTKKRTYGDISKDLENIGADFNASTSNTVTGYYFKSLSEKLYEGIDILSDILFNSTFPKTELEKEKKVILEEMKTSLDNPVNFAFRNFTQSIYKGTTLGRPVIGSNKSVKSISRESIKKFIKKNYIPRNMYILVNGNFNEKKLLEKLNEKFVTNSKVREKGENSLRLFKKKMQTLSPEFIFKKKDINATWVIMGMPGVNKTKKQIYTQLVFAEILGGSMSSRLFLNIREDKGLCYLISAQFDSNDDFKTCCFSVVTSISHENIGLTVKEIFKEIKNMENVSEEELNRVKVKVKTGSVFANEDREAKSFLHLKSYISKGKLFDEKKMLKTIESITINDIKKIAKHFLDINKYTFSIVSNKNVSRKMVLKDIL